MRSIGLLLTLVICACAPKTGGAPATKTAGTGSGSNGLPPPPPQGQTGPTCESAITNSINLSVQAAPDSERAGLKAKLDAAKPTMVTACHEDQWSAALLECLDKARDDASAGKCVDLMSPAQQDGVKRRLETAS